MTPEKQKVIDQAQQIADDGCSWINNCEECLLINVACAGEDMVLLENTMFVAYAFLAGIAFEKDQEPVKNPCVKCGKEWDDNKIDACPHCGNVVPF